MELLCRLSRFTRLVFHITRLMSYYRTKSRQWEG